MHEGVEDVLAVLCARLDEDGAVVPRRLLALLGADALPARGARLQPQVDLVRAQHYRNPLLGDVLEEKEDKKGKVGELIRNSIYQVSICELRTHVDGLDPLADRQERSVARHVVEEHDAVRSAEVAPSDGPEPLLPGRIPQLEVDLQML